MTYAIISNCYMHLWNGFVKLIWIFFYNLLRKTLNWTIYFVKSYNTHGTVICIFSPLEVVCICEFSTYKLWCNLYTYLAYDELYESLNSCLFVMICYVTAFYKLSLHVVFHAFVKWLHIVYIYTFIVHIRFWWFTYVIEQYFIY